MLSTVALKSPAMITSPPAHWSATHCRSLRQSAMNACRGATACTATIVGPAPSTGMATSEGTDEVLLVPSAVESTTA